MPAFDPFDATFVSAIQLSPPLLQHVNRRTLIETGIAEHTCIDHIPSKRPFPIMRTSPILVGVLGVFHFNVAAEPAGISAVEKLPADFHKSDDASHESMKRDNFVLKDRFFPYDGFNEESSSSKTESDTQPSSLTSSGTMLTLSLIPTTKPTEAGPAL